MSTLRLPGAARRAVLARSVLLAALALPALGHVQATTVVDDRGVTVRLTALPRRVITLMPALTESICALGACERLVGTDRYSDQPPAVRALPKLGGVDDANVERIVSLRPDVVVLSPSMRITERLEGLGLKVVVLEPHNYEDMQRVFSRLSELLGSGDAAGLWRRIDGAVDAAARSMPAALRGTRVYYEVDSTPFAAGEASFIGQTLQRFGLRNIVPRSLGPFPRLNPEFVVRADPQLIMVARSGVEALRSRPGWSAIAAVRGHGICPLSPDDANVLTRPGPRMALGAAVVARCLRELQEGTLP